MNPFALKANTVTRAVHFHFFKADRLRLWSVKVQQQLVATQELLVARTEAFVNDDDEAQYGGGGRMMRTDSTAATSDMMGSAQSQLNHRLEGTRKDRDGETERRRDEATWRC